MQIGLHTEGSSEIRCHQPSRFCVTCRVCPHNCELTNGEFGKCMVRCNTEGSLSNPFEGRCSLLSVEPIEKRPFFHYRPGTKYLAVGFYGCSFRCQFCQNFKVSQTTNGESLYKSPEELVALANHKAQGVAFTFNEPTIYHEYVHRVRELGADVVLKTNGFVNGSIVDELSAVSAWNVDIKGDDQEYERTCGGKLKPVMETIEHLSGKSHLEISYLVLPRMVSDMAFHERMRDFLAGLNPDIPVHILYFYPFHKMTDSAYQPYALFPIIKLFQKRLRYIYVSNAFHSELVEYRHTYCDQCKGLLIERLRGVRVHKSSCCGRTIKFVAG